MATEAPLEPRAARAAGPVPRVRPQRVPRIDASRDLDALARALGPARVPDDVSCSEHVHTLLRDAIVRARLLPGTPLSEATVARVLGVSRTPVREALRELAKDQLVRVYPQAATVVAPLSMDGLYEGCFIRRSLECANIVDLAPRIAPGAFKELNALLRAQRDAIAAGRPEEFYRADEEMHRCLFDVAGRHQTWLRLSRVKQHLDRVRWLLSLNPAHLKRNLGEHRHIIALLRSGDGAGAARAMYDHINAFTQDVMTLRDRAPDRFFES